MIAAALTTLVVFGYWLTFALGWFKIDDGFWDHPKAKRAGKDGRALWAAGGAKCCRLKTDGVIEDIVAADAAYQAGVKNWKVVAAILVDQRLWHDAATIGDCPSCRDHKPKLQPGWFYMHEFLDWQFSKQVASDPAERRRRQRRNELMNDGELRRQIQERDGSRCRYCAIRVNWSARRGPAAATYDHVDPDLWNELDNVVTACNTCNGRKGHRTPREWAAEGGRHLLPPPHDPSPTVDDRPSRTQHGPSNGSNKKLGPIEHEPGLAGASRATVPRAGSELGPDQIGPSSVAGRAGPGRQGPGRAPDQSSDLKPSSLRHATASVVSASAPSTSPTQEVTDVR